METTFEIPTTVDPTIDAFFDRATDNDSDDVSAFETTSSYDGEEDVGDGYFEFGLYQVAVPVLFGAVAIVGATGNALVIYVILSRERMRTVTNLLLLNLAVADLAFVTVVPPFTAFQFAAAYWPFGDVACRLMHYLVNVTAYVTVYTLVVVAAMRYLTVVHAARTARFRTRRTTVRLIAGLWAVLSAVNVPVLTSYGTKPLPPEADDDADTSLMDCEMNSVDIGKPLFGTFFAFGYVVPLGLIGVLSIRIVADIHRQRAAASAGVVRDRSLRRKQAVGRTLVLVVGLFAALWLPVHVNLLVWYFGGVRPTERWYSVVSVLANCLAYSNSCVNPIVYNHTSKDFRDSFRSVVQSTFRLRLRSGSFATDGIDRDGRTASICGGGGGGGGGNGGPSSMMISGSVKHLRRLQKHKLDLQQRRVSDDRRREISASPPVDLNDTIVNPGATTDVDGKTVDFPRFRLEPPSTTMNFGQSDDDGDDDDDEVDEVAPTAATRVFYTGVTTSTAVRGCNGGRLQGGRGPPVGYLELKPPGGGGRRATGNRRAAGKRVSLPSADGDEEEARTAMTSLTSQQTDVD